MDFFRKVFSRLLRIILGKRGIDAKEIGTGNISSSHVYINEEAVIGKYNYFRLYTMINKGEI